MTELLQDVLTEIHFFEFINAEIIERSDFLVWIDSENKLDQLLKAFIENDQKRIEETFSAFETWHILELKSKPSKRKALNDLATLSNLRELRRSIYQEDKNLILNLLA